MEFTANIDGQAALIQAAKHKDVAYWRITWPDDDSIDLLHKEDGQWASHTADPDLTERLGVIIDTELAKQN